MEHQRLLMKAMRDFAMADPKNCEREWDAYLALLHRKETVSVSSSMRSTSPVHHRAPTAAVPAPATTRATAPLRASSDAVSTTTTAATASTSTSARNLKSATSSVASASSEIITKDDLSPGARRMYDYLVGASTSLEDVQDAVDIGVAALAVSAPTTCSAECPNHDASVFAAALVPSAPPNSSTTTGDDLSEFAALAVSHNALDVDATGDSAPTATICLPSSPVLSIGGEDPEALFLTPWSVPASFHASPEALPSPPYTISACGDDPDTDDTCTLEMFLYSDVLSILMTYVTQSMLHQRQVLLPVSWQSFSFSEENKLQVLAALGTFLCESLSIGKTGDCLQYEQLQQWRPPDPVISLACMVLNLLQGPVINDQEVFQYCIGTVGVQPQWGCPETACFTFHGNYLHGLGEHLANIFFLGFHCQLRSEGFNFACAVTRGQEVDSLAHNYVKGFLVVIFSITHNTLDMIISWESRNMACITWMKGNMPNQLQRGVQHAPVEVFVIEHWLIPWEPGGDSPRHNLMESFISLAITCELLYSISVGDNLLADRYWLWFMRCVELDTDEPRQCVLYFRPKPPWSDFAPTIPSSEFRSNMRTVIKSRHLISNSLELNQFGVAAWPLLSTRFRPTKAYFLRDDIKHYNSKAPFQTLIPVSPEVSAVIGVELWSQLGTALESTFESLSEHATHYVSASVIWRIAWSLSLEYLYVGNHSRKPIPDATLTYLTPRGMHQNFSLECSYVIYYYMEMEIRSLADCSIHGLYLPWDPGGLNRHRLGDKPNSWGGDCQRPLSSHCWAGWLGRHLGPWLVLEPDEEGAGKLIYRGRTATRDSAGN